MLGSINISGRNETSYLQHFLTAFLFHTNFTQNPLKITLLATSAPQTVAHSPTPAGRHSAASASAPPSPMLLEWSQRVCKLPLLLRLAARAWPLGGVGGTLGIDSSPHLPKHRTHIRGKSALWALPKPTTSGRNHPVAQMIPSKIIFQRQFAKKGQRITRLKFQNMRSLAKKQTGSFVPHRFAHTQQKESVVYGTLWLCSLLRE